MVCFWKIEDIHTMLWYKVVHKQGINFRHFFVPDGCCCFILFPTFFQLCFFKFFFVRLFIVFFALKRRKFTCRLHWYSCIFVYRCVYVYMLPTDYQNDTEHVHSNEQNFMSCSIKYQFICNTFIEYIRCIWHPHACFIAFCFVFLWSPPSSYSFSSENFFDLNWLSVGFEFHLKMATCTNELHSPCTPRLSLEYS